MIKAKVLFFSALLTSSAFFSACSPTKADGFCDAETPCDMGFECNLATNGCDANAQPDGGNIDAGIDIDAIAPVVCEGGNQCVAEVPAEWVGPVVYTTAATMAELPACPSDYSEEVGVLGTEVALSQACECSCGTVANAQCSDAIARVNSGSGNLCPNITCMFGSCPNDVSVPAGGTANPFSHLGTRVSIVSGNVTSGTCEAATVTSDFTSSFDSMSRLCKSAPSTDVCEQGEVCAPSIPAEFEGQRCIAREGEFLCSDTGTFTEQTILYASVDDQRNCDDTECVCDSAVSCGGEVQLISPGNLKVDSGTCFQVPSSLNAGTTYTYAANLTPNCRLNGAAAIVGAATPTGATTLCCEPAL